MFGESGVFLYAELYYQVDMNVDQSTRAIPNICICKKFNMDFLD